MTNNLIIGKICRKKTIRKITSTKRGLFSRIFLFPINFAIIVAVVAFVFFSCSNYEKEISGTYLIDKFAYNDTSVVIEACPFLILHKDKTFNLKKHNGSIYITGNWRIFKRNIISKEVLVEFSYENKKIQGLLKGTIFYFHYPNDFYFGKYNILLYIKSNLNV